MTRVQFRRLVTKAIDELPSEFAQKIKNAAIVVEDWPTREQLRLARVPGGGTLFGLYQGVPQTKRGIYYSSPPDKITLFMGPIMTHSPTPAAVKNQIRRTLLHEIGHHFGLSESELSKKTS